MIIQSKFGEAQNALGYQYYNATGALIGSRITAGISATPEAGTYVANVTLPPSAVGVYWNDTISLDTATEEFATEPDNDGIASIITALEGAEQIITTTPYIPIVGPVAIIPAPVDPDMVTCFLDSQEITGGEDTTLKIEVRIEGKPPAIASLQYLIQKPAMMIHQNDEPGQYLIDLPRGLKFRVNCAELFGVGGKIINTPLTGGSLNIVTAQ